jgi:hypothetical protein
MVVSRTSSHENKKKNELAVQNKAASNSISNYLSTKNISEKEKQLSLAAQEATYAYHIAMHNNSFKSMDCGNFSMINVHVNKQNAEQQSPMLLRHLQQNIFFKS